MPPSELIPEDTLEKAVIFLRVSGHPLRLLIIVNILIRCECQAGELANILGTTQSHTSQQLSKLKLACVLKSRRDGSKVYYSLANEIIKRIVKSIITEI